MILTQRMSRAALIDAPVADVHDALRTWIALVRARTGARDAIMHVSESPTTDTYTWRLEIAAP